MYRVSRLSRRGCNMGVDSDVHDGQQGRHESKRASRDRGGDLKLLASASSHVGDVPLRQPRPVRQGALQEHAV